MKLFNLSAAVLGPLCADALRLSTGVSTSAEAAIMEQERETQERIFDSHVTQFYELMAKASMSLAEYTEKCEKGDCDAKKGDKAEKTEEKTEEKTAEKTEEKTEADEKKTEEKTAVDEKKTEKKAEDKTAEKIEDKTEDKKTEKTKKVEEKKAEAKAEVKPAEVKEVKMVVEDVKKVEKNDAKKDDAKKDDAKKDEVKAEVKPAEKKVEKVDDKKVEKVDDKKVEKVDDKKVEKTAAAEEKTEKKTEKKAEEKTEKKTEKKKDGKPDLRHMTEEERKAAIKKQVEDSMPKLDFKEYKSAMTSVASLSMMLPLLEGMTGKFKDDIRNNNKLEQKSKQRLDQYEKDYAECKASGKNQYLLEEKLRAVKYFRKQRDIQHRHYHAMLKMAHASMERLNKVRKMVGDAATGKTLKQSDMDELTMMLPASGF